MRILAFSLHRAALAFAIATSGLVGNVLAQTHDKVVVASKIDTEGGLLGNMIAIVLEKNGIPVESRVQLGPTKVVRTALLAGEIDIYPEYTGNGAFFFNSENDPGWKSGTSAFEMVKRLDLEKNKLVWLDRAPANNTWLIAVRGDVARRDGLSTMMDFAKAAAKPGAIKLAGSAEFVESPAALPAFEKVYSFKLPRDQIVVLPGGDTAVTMRAAAQGVSGVNAAMVYGTDGAISALDLVVMQDANGAQIVYEPAPVIRDEVLRKYPAIGPALAKVFSTLSMQKLQMLNAKIAVDGQPPRIVAQNYLDEMGLLR